MPTWYRGFTCVYCGIRVAEGRDHVIPRSRGGRGKENMVPACQPCNKAKGSKTPEEFMEFLRWQDGRRAQQHKIPHYVLRVLEPIETNGWRFANMELTDERLVNHPREHEATVPDFSPVPGAAAAEPSSTTRAVEISQ